MVRDITQFNYIRPERWSRIRERKLDATTDPWNLHHLSVPNQYIEYYFIEDTEGEIPTMSFLTQTGCDTVYEMLQKHQIVFQLTRDQEKLKTMELLLNAEITDLEKNIETCHNNENYAEQLKLEHKKEALTEFKKAFQEQVKEMIK